MANIALRSPQYKTKIVGSTSIKSMQLTLNIGGVLRYTINKNITASSMVFEISELCRDYLTVNYSSNNYPQTIAIIATITAYDGVNGTGSVVGTPTVFNDVGWEAYGLYVNGANPVNPVSIVLGTWLIAPIKSESYFIRDFEIFTPIGEDGFVSGMTSAGVFSTYYYKIFEILSETLLKLISSFVFFWTSNFW